MIQVEDVKLAQKGNKEAFTRLITSCQPSMYRVARSFLHSDVEYADAIQETILKAFQKKHTLREHHYFKTWLIRILINECKNILRNKKRLVSMEDIEEKNYKENHFDKIEVWEAIDRLNENQRIIIVLYYFEGFTIGEISQLLELSEGTVKSRLSRAREQLGRFLGSKKGGTFHEQSF